MNKEAFVYCWTDHKDNKLYVGVHKGYAKDGYICSSKKMMEQYNTRPLDFTRQIIAEGSYQEMLVFETSILRSVNAKLNEDFYNGHNGDGKFYNGGHTDETKRKLTGIKHSDKTKEKIRQARLSQPDPRLGKKHSVESIEKMRLAKIGKQHHTKQITIEGVTYNSYKEAAGAIGCHPDVLTRRIKRGLYV